MIHKLPKILRISQFEHVSYSELVDLQQCLLKGSQRRLTLSTPLPDSMPTRATIVGIFHHKAMELATLGLEPEQLERKLEELIRTTEATASAWQHLRRLGPISNWDAINQSFTSAMRRGRAQRNKESVVLVKAENSLTSRDGILLGKPDRYAVVGDRAVLTEFKTSELRDSDGKVRNEYLTQLRFYAALLIDNYPVKEVAAQLESAKGEEFSRVIEANEARKFAVEVRNTVSEVNRRIAGIVNPLDLGSPSADACNYCNLRVLCSAFASRQTELSLDRGQFVLTAIVKSVVRSGASDPIVTFELDRGDRIFRLALPSELLDQLHAGRRYVFANLDIASSTFRWTDMTQVFTVD